MRKRSFNLSILIPTALLVCMLSGLFLTAGGYVHAEEGMGDVSGNNEPAPVCTCTEKCSAYGYDNSCAVCRADYRECGYKKPNVVIQINKPAGWHRDTAAVTFSVTDAAQSGNFELVKLSAKIGQNGSWIDVTEDRKLEISENCTVYAQVTDQKGNTYERSRTVKCFDTTKPTLNAAVSGGLLTVQVQDTESGAKTVYVNGYEFTELTNGMLNIRLQQFDAGYEYFTITAMDHAGNISEVYKTKNPYYKDPADGSDGDPAKQLPADAEASKPGNATGTVTEHIKTDSSGNAVSEKSPAEQKNEALDEADGSGEEKEKSGQGKEFYTIRTASEKVFYLIIDRDSEEETVYFLTEITENDLLNAASDNSETLPKNSAALESAIPVTEEALQNNNGGMVNVEPEKEEGEDSGTEEVPVPEKEELPEDTPAEENSLPAYLLMGAIAVIAIVGACCFKKARRNKEDFLDEEEEEEEYEEEYLEEEEESKEEGSDEFFEEPEE